MDLFAQPASGQSDLFGGPILPGLEALPDFITPSEEADLIAHLGDAGLSPFRFQQWTGKRLSRSFGWSYDFQTGEFTPTDPIPDWLVDLKTRAEAFAGLESGAFVQALLLHYGPGAGIGWHKDRPIFGHVVGISLGEPATMRFRRRVGGRFERVSAPLAPRSIYHMAGEARYGWEHSIAGMEATRWSITFRSLAKG